jgi:hypothetical protein
MIETGFSECLHALYRKLAHKVQRCLRLGRILGVSYTSCVGANASPESFPAAMMEIARE